MSQVDIFQANYAVSNLSMMLDGLIQHDKCILLDWPNYCNVGDHMIWLGQKVIIKKLLRKSVVYESSYQDCDMDIIRSHSSVPILCSGGGNFGDLYINHQKFRENIVKNFPDRTVIFLPQTIYYENTDNLNNTKEELSVYNNFHLFARDFDSLKSAKTISCKSNVYLGIDSAFALQVIMPRIMNAMKTYKKVPLYLIRQDKESRASGIAAEKNAITVDWIEENSLDDYMTISEVRSVIDDCQLLDLIDCEDEITSLVYFVRAVSLFSRADYVVTDRLHAFILAELLGIRCRFHDNSYGKNSSFYKTWMRDDPYVVFKS